MSKVINNCFILTKNLEIIIEHLLHKTAMPLYFKTKYNFSIIQNCFSENISQNFRSRLFISENITQNYIFHYSV